MANDACDTGHVTVNGKEGKPGTAVRVGDVIGVRFGERYTEYEVLSIGDHVAKQAAADMYRAGVNVWAVVVAAGRGARAGFDGTRCFSRGRGTRCWKDAWSAGALTLDGAVLVLGAEDFEQYDALGAREALRRW